MTTTATVSTGSSGGTGLQKSHGSTDVQSAADNSLFAALLQGSLMQPTASGDKTATPIGPAKLSDKPISAGSLSGNLTTVHPTTVHGLSEAAGVGAHRASLTGTSANGPFDVKNALSNAVHASAIPSKGRNVSVIPVQASPLEITDRGSLLSDEKGNEASKPVAGTPGHLAQFSLKLPKAVGDLTDRGAFVRSGEGTNPSRSSALSPVSSAVTPVSSLPVESHAISRTANQRRPFASLQSPGGFVPSSKASNNEKSPDSTLQSTSWAAFTPLAAQPAKPSNPQTGSPTVKFGDLKSVYDITQALIGQADGTNQQIQVQVHPQGLGSLLISVVQTPGGIAVHMQAEQMMTAQWLNGQSSSLINQLQQQGLDVSGVNVSFGSANPQSGGSDGQQRRNKAVDGISLSRPVATSALSVGLRDGTEVTLPQPSHLSWGGTGYSAWV